MVDSQRITQFGIHSSTMNKRARIQMFAISALVLSSANTFCQDQNSIAYRAVAIAFSKIATSPLVLERPASLIDPLYDSSDPKEDSITLGNLNALLVPSLLYKPAPQNLADVYSQILKGALWAETPLTATQRQQLSTARVGLFGSSGNKPTVEYQRYLDLKQAFDIIQKKYDSTPPDQIDPQLENARNQAEQDLNLKGHRAQYEAIEAKYSSLQDQSSYKWRDADLHSLPTVNPSGPAINLLLLPRPSTPLDNIDTINWTDVSLTDSQLRDSTATPVFGSSLANPSPAWFDGFYSNDVNTSGCPSNFPVSNISIRFSVGIVTLDRDWLDSKVFNSRAWRWKVGGYQISDGNLDGNKGVAPLYINSAVIVKDLIVSGPGLSPCIAAIRSASKARRPVNFGPFALAGSIASPSSLYLAPIISQQSVRFSYLQIVAFGVSALPLAPNPDLDFAWPQP